MDPGNWRSDDLVWFLHITDLHISKHIYPDIQEDLEEFFSTTLDTIKTEYPSSGQQYQYQYHPYQRLAQPYQHYPAYQHLQYEMAPSQSYPGYQQSPVTVPVERWGQQPASYQVKEDNITLLTHQSRPPSDPI